MARKSRATALRSFQATSAHTRPNLGLILGATGYEDINFSGRLVTETEIRGTLNGSGVNDYNINLRRR